jgi:hypothetical protein
MNTEEITKKLQALEARTIVNTIALNLLYCQAPPEVGKLLLEKIQSTADYALSKTMTDDQIELLLPLAHQIAKRA